MISKFLVLFCFRVHDFEYTTECIIFDLLHISLYHGWLVDPQNQDEVQAVGKCSYNQLVEKIIGNKTSDKQEEVREGKIDKKKTFDMIYRIKLRYKLLGNVAINNY